MNELALFAGAGGGILGGHLLGWRCVCAVEINSYAASVLCARQNDGVLPPFPIWDDVRTFDGRPWRGIVDVVSGGFPCQDISSAGKGKGITGERSGLWKEMARIIGEVRPRYVLVENSPMLVVRGLGVVLGDLAALGYDARWGVLGAHHAGAPHKRDRIWILAHIANDRTGRREQPQCREGAGHVAHADSGRCEQRHATERGVSEPNQTGANVADTNGCLCAGRADEPQRGAQGGVAADGRGEAVPNTNGQRLEKRLRQRSDAREECAAVERGDWWQSEPDVGRVAHGLAARVHRLTAIGNGQVPAVVKLAWEELTHGTADTVIR